jgi:hypothetical protein
MTDFIDPTNERRVASSPNGRWKTVWHRFTTEEHKVFQDRIALAQRLIGRPDPA